MTLPALPRTAWLATGVAAGAGGVAIGVGAVGVLVVGLLGIAIANGLGRGQRAGRLALGSAAVGAVLLGVRVLVGPAAAPPAALPGAAGPWTGVVESLGSPRDGSQVARVRLVTAAGDVVVAATLPAFPTVAAGAVIEVDGRLRPPPDDDPYGDYLRRTGASGSLDARRLTVLVAPGPSLQAARDAAGDALRVALPEPEAGLAAGILIGLRERVDRTLAADFATAGVSHVVAISGWNIAIVAGLVGAALRGRSRRMVAVVVLGTVAAYVVAAGASPSVVRAAVMATVVIVARESGRAGRAAAALGAAAAILLLLDPALIGDAGFRLSVMATAGLLAWATPLGERLGRAWGGRLPRWLADSLGISLAAQAATLPDVIATFGRLSIVSPVVNLAVVPLVPVAMAGGVLALAGGAIAAAGAPAMIATLAGLPGWLVLHLVVVIVRVAVTVPVAAVTVPPELTLPLALVSAVAVLVTPSAARAWGGRRRRMPTRRTATAPNAPPGARTRGTSNAPRIGRNERLALVGLAIVVGLSSIALVDSARRETRVVVLDIGQGDAILVESETGARMLVDGGPDPERTLLRLDEEIPPWDRRIDVVVLSHPHEDHVAGLVRVLERYRVGRVFEPGMHGPGPGWEAWDRTLRDGPPRGTLAAGAVIHLGEITLTALWPAPGTVPEEPGSTGRIINDTSIILLGEAHGRRFLLTGDAEDDVDPQLLARGLPRIDLLKVAHHGSATATSAAFLDAVRPTVAAISVGADNDYGHPAPSTVGRLQAVGARVFRTDLDGTVSIGLRRQGLEISTAHTRAAGARTGYDRPHDDPRTPRRRPPADLAGRAGVVPAARVRGRGRGGVPRGADAGERRRGGRPAGRSGRVAPRRRQAARCRGPGAPPPRRGVGGVAGGERPGGAGTGGP